MGSKKSKKMKDLEMAVAALRARFGPRAVRKAKEEQAVEGVPPLPTGFPVLDEALGIGGIPRGRVTEFIGAYTSGKTTVLLKTIARATATGEAVAFIDLERTFNPDYAQRAGVNLSRLILPPARHPLQALEIARDLVIETGIGVVVFNDVANFYGEDRAATWLSATLRQTVGALHRSHCALVFLTTPMEKHVSPDDYPSGFALAHFASLRLNFELEQVLRQRDGTRGFRLLISVLKNKLAPPARRPVTLDIFFNGTVESNGIM